MFTNVAQNTFNSSGRKFFIDGKAVSTFLPALLYLSSAFNFLLKQT